jgi:hypothetical protein
MPDLLDPQIRQDHRCIRDHLRRQCNGNGRKTGSYQTTVGDVAAATGLSVADVAAHLKDAWLIILGDTDPDMAKWTIEEDGE